jgi:hypothetical protein
MSLEHGRPDDFDGTIHDDRLYTRNEVARILGIRRSALEHDVVSGHLGIPYVKIGAHHVRYQGKSLKAYLAERERVPLGAPG